MSHAPGFLKMVQEAQPRVKEIDLQQAREILSRNPQAKLVDVREDLEWQKAHAQEAIHLSKGVLERDIEEAIPDPNSEIIMYCGGGFRSVLTCDAAQKMGYKKVYSLKGGYKGMVSGNWPMTSE